MDDMEDDGCFWVGVSDEEQTGSDLGDLVALTSQDEVAGGWRVILDYIPCFG